MFSAGQKISQGMLENEQRKLNEAVAEGLRIQKGTNRDLESENHKLEMENADLRIRIARESENARKLQEYKEEVEYYEQLLCKPMLEIARQNGQFKKTYEEQMTIMADWMVSQKAFKELAIEFGWDKGLKTDDVVEMGLDKEINVLEDKHDKTHRTNTDTQIIGPRKEKLIEKYYKDKMLRTKK